MRKSVITKDNYEEYINFLNYLNENKKAKKIKLLSSGLVLAGCAFFGTAPLILHEFTSMPIFLVEGIALLVGSVTFIDLGVRLFDTTYRNPTKELFPNIDTDITKKKLEEKINSYEDDLRLSKAKELEDTITLENEPIIVETNTIEKENNKVKVMKYN